MKNFLSSEIEVLPTHKHQQSKPVFFCLFFSRASDGLSPFQETLFCLYENGRKKKKPLNKPTAPP
jgi:hypothetical protein